MGKKSSRGKVHRIKKSHRIQKGRKNETLKGEEKRKD